jgi:Uma2 family endonuclease
MAVRVIDPTQRRLLTVEEWVEHPEADQYELIDGVLRARIAYPNWHEYAVARLGALLTGYLDDLGCAGAAFGSKTKYRVRTRRGIMPDLSVVLGEKLDAIDPDGTYNTIGPDLAVEVLSPEQEADYIEERLDDYQKLGTAEVWVVDPWAGTVTGYVRGPEGYGEFARAQGVEEFRSQLLPGLSFSVGRLWMRRP